jgi:chromosome partitioning protein
MDPQGNSTSGLGITNPEKSIYDLIVENKFQINEVILSTPFPNLFLIPSSFELAATEVELINQKDREYKLKKALESIKDEYKYIIIDSPPSLGLLTINGLVACDSVLIPVQCEYYALEGLGKLLQVIDLIKRSLNRNLKIEGFLLTMYDARTNLSQQVEEEVRSVFKEKVYNTIIPKNVKLAEAPSFSKPIIFYDATSTGASSYMSFSYEFLNKQGK